MIKIVTIGGGNGQSKLLSELKQYPIDITAVVSMIDNGGSTGVIRKDYNVLPSGDIRRCFIALASDQPDIQAAMNYRFPDGFLANHNFGNLLMLVLERRFSSYEKMIDFMHCLLKVKGRVLPVTFGLTNLIAELDNGEKIIGETNIDVPKHKPIIRIRKIYLEKAVSANPAAIKAIGEADIIIYTIGDLYTSIIPNLLVDGIKEALSKSKAKKIYTCNRTTKKGETQGFTLKDYIDTLKQYLGNNSLDYVIIDSNQEEPPAGYELVEKGVVEDVKMLEADVSSPLDRAHIDSAKLAKYIWSLSQSLS